MRGRDCMERGRGGAKSWACGAREVLYRSENVDGAVGAGREDIRVVVDAAGTLRAFFPGVGFDPGAGAGRSTFSHPSSIAGISAKGGLGRRPACGWVSKSAGRRTDRFLCIAAFFFFSLIGSVATLRGTYNDSSSSSSGISVNSSSSLGPLFVLFDPASSRELAFVEGGRGGRSTVITEEVVMPGENMDEVSDIASPGNPPGTARFLSDKGTGIGMGGPEAEDQAVYAVPVLVVCLVDCVHGVLRSDVVLDINDGGVTELPPPPSKAEREAEGASGEEESRSSWNLTRLCVAVVDEAPEGIRGIGIRILRPLETSRRR